MLTRFMHPYLEVAVRQIQVDNIQASTDEGHGRFRKECWLPASHLDQGPGQVRSLLSCLPSRSEMHLCPRSSQRSRYFSSPRPLVAYGTTRLVVPPPPLAAEVFLPPSAFAIKRCLADMSRDWLLATKEEELNKMSASGSWCLTWLSAYSPWYPFCPSKRQRAFLLDRAVCTRRRSSDQILWLRVGTGRPIC